MIGFPMAKINLGLHVLRKRSDGYHDIETIFYPIPFYDVLEILPSSEDRFHVHRMSMEGNAEQNLVVRALNLIRQTFPQRVPPVEIHLVKNIPMGAGLAGGSSDASTTLLLLNELFDLQITAGQLRELAASLGSDCPFFIQPVPSFAAGRGEILKPIELDLADYNLTLFFPPFSISTKEAFSKIQPRVPQASLDAYIHHSPSQWKDRLVNDFEAPLWEPYPALKACKETLYQRGAHYVSLTGTGSTIYALSPRTLNLGLEEQPIPGFRWKQLSLGPWKSSP